MRINSCVGKNYSISIKKLKLLSPCLLVHLCVHTFVESVRLPVFLLTCLSLCLSVCLSSCLPFHLCVNTFAESVRLSVFLPPCLSPYLSVCLSVPLSASPPVWPHICSICQFICLIANMSISLPACLPISPSVYLCFLICPHVCLRTKASANFSLPICLHVRPVLSKHKLFSQAVFQSKCVKE